MKTTLLAAVLISSAAFAQRVPLPSGPPNVPAPLEEAPAARPALPAEPPPAPRRIVALTVGAASLVGILSGEVEVAPVRSFSFFAGGVQSAWGRDFDYRTLTGGVRWHMGGNGVEGAWLDLHGTALFFHDTEWLPSAGCSFGYTWVWQSGFTVSAGAGLSVLPTGARWLPIWPVPEGRLALGYAF